MNAVTQTTDKPTGAFASHAIEFFDMGLAPIPTGGENGKRPMIKKFADKQLAPDILYSMASDSRFRDSNIAVVCGHSDLNVIDVDNPDLLTPMLKRFGNTPMIVRTAGRGGYHLFYKATKGIGPRDFRTTEGIEVEIKAEGNILMFPPSVHPVTGLEWEFIDGGLSDLHRLPRLKIDTLIPRTSSKGQRRQVEQGHRNDWLFKQCLREAPRCDNFDALLDVARTRADEFMAALLADSEIVACAKSAWKYNITGENWVGKEARYTITRTEYNYIMERSKNGADTLALHTLLVMEHALRVARGKTFRLTVKSMAKAETVPLWAPNVTALP